MSVGIVYTRKGGTGKTTTTSALGEYFSQVRKRPTLLIDLDGQGSLTSIYKVDTSHGTILDVLEERKSIKQVAQEVAPLLFIAPSHKDLYQWEYNESGVQALGKALRGAKSFVTLIDCGPAFTDLSKTALVAGTFLIIPTQPSMNDMLALRSFYDTIVHARQEGIKLPAHVVLTRVQGRTNLHKQAIESVHKSPFHIFKTMISESVVVQEAAVEGRSIVTYRKWHKVARQYMSLGREVEQCLTG